MGNASSKAARKLPKVKQAPLAFESRNEAKDLQFMAKLSQLGQVQVEHRTKHSESGVANMYRARVQAEADASNAQTRNRLLASSLAELLEARKSVTSSDQLETLAEQHHVDVATLQRLGRVVTTPSMDESLAKTARWVDPAVHTR